MGRVPFAIVLLSYAGTAVMTGFNVDRTIWDTDNNHLGDTDSLRYVSFVTLSVYSMLLAADCLACFANVYFRLHKDREDIAWIQEMRGNWHKYTEDELISTTREWLERTNLWISAMSIALTAVSIATLSFDRYWAYDGGYSQANLSVMIAISALLLVINTFLLYA